MEGGVFCRDMKLCKQRSLFVKADLVRQALNNHQSRTIVFKFAALSLT